MTTPTTVSVRLQLRADTAANWTSANPTLLANELGRETDTGKIKIGDGSTAWSSLAYQAWATLPIAVASGGTGQTSYTNGQLLIGNTTGNTLTKATLTAGSGIAITNGTGSITVAASGISDAQIAADAEIAVSKLADGAARQLLQTDAAGTGVEWASNIDIPGTLDVTSAATFDSTIGASAGTASLPSITFTGDLNTGIYSPGADQVAISTNGSGRLRVSSTGTVEIVGAGTIGSTQAVSFNGSAPVNSMVLDSSGRLGVGTSTPSNTLHVAGTGSTQAVFERTGSNGVFIGLKDGSGNLTYLGNTNGVFSVQTPGSSYSDKLVVTSAGLVGIGVSGPLKKTEIRSTPTTADTDGLRVGDGTRYMEFAQTGATYNYMQVGGNRNLIYFSGSDLHLSTDGANAITLNTNSLERVRVTSGGLVGIGTTSPGTYNANLAVYSAGGAFVGALHANASGTFPKASAISLGSDAVSYTYTTGGASVALTGSAHIAALQSASSGAGTDIAFINTSNGNVSEKARIDSSGRLLVGTSTARSINGLQHVFQIEGTTLAGSSLSVMNNTNDQNPPYLTLGKSKGGSLNSAAAVAADTGLGAIAFMGADGTSLLESATIKCFVDGTPGTNDLPTRLVFSTTADGASSPTERMRITQAGGVRLPDVYNATIALSANVFIDTDGTLKRATSSIKYKTNVETLEDQYADAVLNCRPVWYQSTSAGDNPNWGFWGFIAEEVAEIDPRLVQWKTVEQVTNEDGSRDTVPLETPKPENVAYDRFVPHLLNLIKRQQQAIEDLQAKVAALEAQ